MGLDQRTADEKFDDMLADGQGLDEISYRIGWPIWRVLTHYRKVCAEMGEAPDDV
jgi:hypothetical protein